MIKIIIQILDKAGSLFPCELPDEEKIQILFL